MLSRVQESGCPQCQVPIAPTQPAVAPAKRQVYDWLPLAPVVTEHQAETVVCPGCEAPVSGEFPPAVTQPTPYGPGVKPLAV